jgi:uncharacterized protein (DUF1330 family)
VTDPVGFEEYRKQVPVTVEKYGGKFLVRGGQVQTLGGDWKPKRIVVTEFRGSGRRPALVRHAISRNIIVAVVMCSRSRVALIASAR